MRTVFEWIPRTLIGFLAPVGGADGVDLAGFALGQVKVLSRKVHCMSLSSIHILYNHTPAAPLRPHPELCCGLIIFHWTEVVLTYETGGGQRTYVHNTIADQHSTQISDQVIRENQASRGTETSAEVLLSVRARAAGGWRVRNTPVSQQTTHAHSGTRAVTRSRRRHR